MSHFTVLVIGDDVEGQLLPYMENCCGEPPREYMEFFNVEEEYAEEYETDTTEVVKFPDGKMVHSFDNQFKNPDYDWAAPREEGNPEYIYPYPPEKVPVKELYPTFQEYLQEYCGYSYDEEAGAYGYWQNPNAKWDWYQIGGRWSGMLKLKEEAIGNGALGETGVMDTCYTKGEDRHTGQWADQALKGEIDFEGMKRESERRYREGWREYSAKVDEILDNPELNGEEKQKRINTEKWLRGIKDEESEDEFATVRTPFSTFAVIKGGQWYEKGEMGWWACVSNEKDQRDWDEEFGKLLEEVDDDTLLTIVDCHI